MIRHLFKLIWNRKRRNILLMIEILFSFIVLFVVTSMVFSSTHKYLKPRGFEYDNVWVLKLGWHALLVEKSNAELRSTLAQLGLEMQSQEEIASFSWASGNIPYQNAVWSTIIKIEGEEIKANFTKVGDNFTKVLKMPVVEGRWFGPEDDAATYEPIVLDAALKKKIFGEEPAVGYIYTNEDTEFRIVGVTGPYRFKSDYEDHIGGLFQRYMASDTIGRPPEAAVIAVRPGTTVKYEEKLLKRLSSIAPGWNLRIENLENLYAGKFRDMAMGIVTVGILAGFLVFNVALGLFGILWYSISRRRSEIGLRRALGADAGKISWQILGEALTMATIAITIGVIITIQVPLLGFDTSTAGGVYIVAILSSICLIYFIVGSCAAYPSFLATRIQPAEVLHDE